MMLPLGPIFEFDAANEIDAMILRMKGGEFG